jgi:hypothetical protein
MHLFDLNWVRKLARRRLATHLSKQVACHNLHAETQRPTDDHPDDIAAHGDNGEGNLDKSDLP